MPRASIPAYKEADVWKEFTNIEPLIPVGDINGDESIDVSDLNDFINILLNIKSSDDFPGKPDVNGDGTVDISDLNAIINIALGI